MWLSNRRRRNGILFMYRKVLIGLVSLGGALSRPRRYKILFSIAVLKFQSKDSEKFSRFVFHTVQLLPNKSYRSTECYKVRKGCHTELDIEAVLLRFRSLPCQKTAKRRIALA